MQESINPLSRIQLVRQENKCIFCLENCGFVVHKNSWCECFISYHINCYNEWDSQNKNDCPICRKKLDDTFIIINISEHRNNIQPIVNNNQTTYKFVLAFIIAIVLSILIFCIKVIVEYYMNKN